jgi:hypothetical protein
MAVPIIRRYELPPEASDFLTAWEFDDSGIMVPSQESGQPEIALWHGKFAGGEAPVLVRPFAFRETTVNKLLGWNYGLAREQEITNSGDPLNDFIDAATYNAGTLPNAIGILACMVRTNLGSTNNRMLPELSRTTGGARTL